VSAAMPGGDQLAAALAAGDTPSPEMVAAAGERSALRPAVGVGLVAFTLAMLAVLTMLSGRFAVFHRIPLPRSTDSLKDRAQELIERLGYTDSPADTAYAWDLNIEYLQWARPGQATPNPWPALSSGRTQTALFWYRTSPAPLQPSYSNNQPTQVDPPLTLSTMRLVRLDPNGRLLEFHAVPPQVEEPSPVAPTAADWAPLFEAAGLPLAAFHDVEPRWTPRSFADTRRAWEGPLPGVPEVTARVEAASYRGRPMYFSVLPPWTMPGRMVAPAANAVGNLLTALAVLIAFALLTVTLILARRHLRTGRGDRRGAFRTASVLFVVVCAGFLLRARVFSDLAVEYERLGLILAISIYNALNVWLFYIALEPYVRRFWPQLLIGWTRLISGYVRDPLVGRDVLLGVAAGTVGAFLIASRELAPHLLGLRPATPVLPSPLILLGARHVLAVALQIVRRALGNAMQCVGIVVFLKIVVKRTWLVLALSTIAILPIAMSGTFAAEQLSIELPIALLGIALVLTVLLRFGLLSLFVTFYTFLLIEAFPLTTDFSRPYAGTSVALLAAVAGLSVCGLIASRGDEPIFGRTILD